jgi:DNA modification methylase
MKIENVKLSQIKANKSNPRVIKDHKFHKLVKSLLVLPKMLELRPIVVSNDMTILGGNMRFRALQHIAKLPEDERIKILESSNDYNIKKDSDKEKLKAYWNVFCDSPIVPIVKANELSDAEQKEFIIKDNASFGEWDFDCLANEWDVADLNDWGIDLPTFDIDEGEEEREIIEDEVPEVDDKAEPICKKGDIWQLGRHRLMCGDSTDKECVDKLMNGEVADITFSSPPYNMMAGGFDNALKSEKVNASYNITNGTYNEFNDKLSDEDYENLLKKTLDLGLSNSDDVLFNIGILSGSKKGIIGMLNSYKDKFLDILVWNKNNSIPLSISTNKGMVSHRCELIFCFNKKGTRCFSHPQWDKGVYKGEVMHNRIDSRNASNNEYGKIHHATFPVEFASQIIERFSENSVIDFFGGTGTTLIACEQLDRTCYMMELDPKYCDVIIARWEKLTNQKATKIN